MNLNRNTGVTFYLFIIYLVTIYLMYLRTNKMNPLTTPFQSHIDQQPLTLSMVIKSVCIV